MQEEGRAHDLKLEALRTVARGGGGDSLECGGDTMWTLPGLGAASISRVTRCRRRLQGCVGLGVASERYSPVAISITVIERSSGLSVALLRYTGLGHQGALTIFVH